MEDQVQQKQANVNEEDHQDLQPVSTVEEILQFTQPARKLHLSPESQAKGESSIARTGRIFSRHESDVEEEGELLSPPPQSPMLHSDEYKGLGSGSVESWVGRQGRSSLFTGAPMAAGFKFRKCV